MIDILSDIDISILNIPIVKRRPKVLEEIPVNLKSIVKRPITVTPNTGILEARDILLKHRIGRLIVEVNKKAVGIITEKDIARNLSVFAKKPIVKIRLAEIMTKDLITIFSDGSINDCAKLMKKYRISSVIVQNKNGKLYGIVTKTDLVSTFLVQSTASLKIAKIMNRKVITVSPDDSILEVESVLINNKISRVIVAKNKIPVGVITYRDFVPAKTHNLLREFTDPIEREEIAWNTQLNEFNVNRLSYLLTFRAKDIMTRKPFFVSPGDVVYTAAILMIRNGISGLPVLMGKKLVGIITKSDIVNVLASKGKI